MGFLAVEVSSIMLVAKVAKEHCSTTIPYFLQISADQAERLDLKRLHSFSVFKIILRSFIIFLYTELSFGISSITFFSSSLVIQLFASVIKYIF